MASTSASASASTSTAALYASRALPSSSSSSSSSSAQAQAQAGPSTTTTRHPRSSRRNPASSPAGQSALHQATNPTPNAGDDGDDDREPDTESDDFNHEEQLPPPVGMRPASKVAAATAARATSTWTNLNGNVQRNGHGTTSEPPSASTVRARAETSVLDLTDDQEEASPSQQDESFLILNSSQPQTQHPKNHGTLKRSRSQSRSRSRSSSNPPSTPRPSLSTLTCPICFGPPVPIAATSCGHVFCAPCLHAALLAGPALTPPPAGAGGNGGAFGRRGGGGGGGGLFNMGAEGGRGRGRGRNARNGVMAGSRGVHRAHESGWGAMDNGEADDYDIYDPAADASRAEAPPGELDKHCPVCRKPLRGGWGRALRGVVLRMEPRKRNDKASGTGKGKIKEGDSDREQAGGGIGGSGGGR